MIVSAFSVKLSDTSQLVDFCPVGYATSTIGSTFSGKLNDKSQLVGFCLVGYATSTIGSASAESWTTSRSWLREKYSWFGFLRKVTRQVAADRLLPCGLRDKYNWFGFCGKLNDKSQLVGFCPVGVVHPATYNNILSNELRCWINSILAFVMIK